MDGLILTDITMYADANLIFICLKIYLSYLKEIYGARKICRVKNKSYDMSV